jgi:hypothetical protein
MVDLFTSEEQFKSDRSIDVNWFYSKRITKNIARVEGM